MRWLTHAEVWVRHIAPGWLRATIVTTLLLTWAFAVSVITLHFMPK